MEIELDFTHTLCYHGGSMIQKRTPINPIFFVQCGDWETIGQAVTPRQACVQAINKATQKYGDKLELSKVIIAMNIQDQMENREEAISAFTVKSLSLA